MLNQRMKIIISGVDNLIKNYIIVEKYQTLLKKMLISKIIKNFNKMIFI